MNPTPQIESLESRLCLAAESAIDASFGGPRGVFFTFPSPGAWAPARDLAIDAHDRLLIGGRLVEGDVGNLTLTRLRTDGAPDPSFGVDGTILAPDDPGGALVSRGVAGGVVLGGAERWSHQRFDAQGEPLHAGGLSQAVDLPGNEIADAMILQPDGKVLTVGRAGRRRNVLAITRHLPNGTLDPSFDGDGQLYTRLKVAGYEVAFSTSRIAVDRRGRILLETGWSALRRFLPNGRPDLSFGKRGVTYGSSGPIALDGNGRILVGQAHYLTRLRPNGSVDTTFGRKGVAESGGGRMHVAPDGAIYHAGQRVDGSYARIGSERVDRNGFAAGAATLDDERYDLGDAATDSAMQRDGRVVLAIFHGGTLRLVRFKDPLPQSSRLEYPGQIRVWEFDDGGPGVAYRDTDRAGEALYRGVVRTDFDGLVLTRTRPGEWLEYTVDSTGGVYDIGFSVASAGRGGSFHLELDGVDLTGRIAVPNTGGRKKFRTLTRQITLPAGNPTLRLVFDTAGPSGSAGNFADMTLTRGIDPAFAGDGSADVGPGLVLPRPDGEIVVVHLDGGLSLLARNGTIDYTRTPAADWNRTVFAILQPDWKILAVTHDNADAFDDGGLWRTVTSPDGVFGTPFAQPGRFSIRRFNPDGTPDVSFGEGGVIPAPAGIRRLAFQPGGKIVAGNPPARYLHDGTPDPTFTPAADAPGQLIGADAAGHLYTVNYRLGPDERNPEYEYWPRVPLFVDLRRLRPDGTADPAYGVGGVATTKLSEYGDDDPTFFDPQVLPDGTVMAGTVTNNKDDINGAYYSGVLVIGPDGVRGSSPPQYDQGWRRMFGGRHLTALPDGRWAMGGHHPVDHRFAVAPTPRSFLDALPGVRSGEPATHLRQFAGDAARVLDVALEASGDLLVSTTAGLFRYHGTPTVAE